MMFTAYLAGAIVCASLLLINISKTPNGANLGIIGLIIGLFVGAITAVLKLISVL